MDFIQPAAGGPIDAAAPFPNDQPPAEAVQERIVRNQIRVRRNRILRTVGALFGSGVLICLFVVWQRDSITIDETLRALNRQALALQARIDELGTLPATLPGIERSLPVAYIDAAGRFYTLNSGKPTIVAATADGAGQVRTIPLLLRPNGVAVIIYDAGKVHADWLPERQFNARWISQGEDMNRFEEQRRARPPQLPE